MKKNKSKEIDMRQFMIQVQSVLLPMTYSMLLIENERLRNIIEKCKDCKTKVNP